MNVMNSFTYVRVHQFYDTSLFHERTMIYWWFRCLLSLIHVTQTSNNAHQSYSTNHRVTTDQLCTISMSKLRETTCKIFKMVTKHSMYKKEMSRSSLLLFSTFTKGKLVTPKEVTMNNDPVSSLPGPLNSGWSFLNSHRKQQLKIIKLEKKEKI